MRLVNTLGLYRVARSFAVTNLWTRDEPQVSRPITPLDNTSACWILHNQITYCAGCQDQRTLYQRQVEQDSINEVHAQESC